MQTAGHFTKTEVNSQTCQHIQTVYETSHLFTVQQEVIASWGYLYFRQQRTDKKRKCTYTKHYKPLRGIRFQFVSWLELLYHEFESYCHCSMPQKVFIGSVRVLLIYLHSGSPPSPKLYLDFVLGWWEYPGSKHGETSMLWTFSNVLRGSLSKHTVNVCSSRTLILALTALSECLLGLEGLLSWKLMLTLCRLLTLQEGKTLINMPLIGKDIPISFSLSLIEAFL